MALNNNLVNKALLRDIPVDKAHFISPLQHISQQTV